MKENALSRSHLKHTRFDKNVGDTLMFDGLN